MQHNSSSRKLVELSLQGVQEFQSPCRVNKSTSDNYKIIRIVHALSLVNSCVSMRVWKHSCDITQILIGYVLSDACFGRKYECVSRKSVSIKK